VSRLWSEIKPFRNTTEIVAEKGCGIGIVHV